jgi:hypothetical protein
VASYAIGDGIFIGSNFGEWLGDLVFRDYFLRSYHEYEIIKNDCIHYIFPYNNYVYVLTGLAHLGVDEGHLYILEFSNDKWKINEKINIKSSPCLYSISNENLIVITNKGLVIFDGKKIIKELNGQKWDCLYANSLYITKENIFIGARGCVFSIDKNEYKTKMYKQNSVA